MSTCIVNGKRYQLPEGSSVSIINNKVYCNGQLVTDTNEFKEKNINIVIEGNIDGDLKVDSGNITVYGECNNVQSISGDITIKGNICGNVKTTSGDVSCSRIAGSTQTVSGDIIKRTSLFDRL